MNTIGVIGAGQMGAGIAQVAASVGYDVVVVDNWEAACERGATVVQKSLTKLSEKGILSHPEDIFRRIRWSTSLADVQNATMVIEAVIENEKVKKDLFAQLDGLMSKDAILASNTSSLSITRLARSTSRPEKVIGMHFMNPVPLMKLVEIIRAHQTSDETTQVVISLAEQMGKVTTVSKDFPGFISNRILMPMINEAFYVLMEGIASEEDIDTTMKLGMNHPMGPLTLADYVGLDTCLAVMEVLFQGLGDAKYRPCPLLRQYVDAGYLGKKTNRGVYSYS